MSSYLVGFFDDEEFVTALLADVSDPALLTLVSCGHPPAILVRRDGVASFLDAPTGLPLGLGQTYDSTTVPWGPGDRLLMYTDGLSEARDASGEFLPLLPWHHCWAQPRRRGPRRAARHGASARSEWPAHRRPRGDPAGERGGGAPGSGARARASARADSDGEPVKPRPRLNAVAGAPPRRPCPVPGSHRVPRPW